MPYHVKAAVNHMHYCSSAYINHYEIFLGEKCSRACREPLCPLFKWNKLVILRAWQIICNKSLGDFLLLVNGDCIFQSHHAPKELKSGSCNRAEGEPGEPPKPAPVSLHRCSADSGGLVALGHKVTFLHGTAPWCINPSAHLRLTQQPLTLLFYTGVWTRSGLGFNLTFSFLPFWEEERKNDLWIPRGFWRQISQW